MAFEQQRYRHVTPIRRWCAEGEPGRVWLLAGGPGSGKIRLVVQVAARLSEAKPQRWTCGWVRAQGAQAIELARRWHQPVLAVVDDADVRHDLADILTALRDSTGSQVVRSLLVARNFGDWWIGVQERLAFEVDVAETMTRLGALVAGAQRVAARRTVAAFAAEENVEATRVQLIGIRAGTPLLLLHAAALEGVLRIKHGEPGPVDVDDAVGPLLARAAAVAAAGRRCLALAPNQKQ